MDENLKKAERELALGGGLGAIEAFLVRQRRAGEGPTLNLQEFMLPKGSIKSYCRDDCRSCEKGYAYHHNLKLPRSRSGLIQSLTDSRLKVDFETWVGDYQGTVYAILNLDFAGGIKILWRDNFGSCSSCDGLQAVENGAEAYDYIKATLGLGNSIPFWSMSKICDYLLSTEDWAWAPKTRLNSWGDNDYYEFLKKIWEAAGRDDLPPVETFKED